VRRLFTTAGSGLSIDALKWGARAGRWVRVQRGVYADGPEPPTPLDRARGSVLASSGEARGCLAGVLHDLDGIVLDGRPVRRDRLPASRIVEIEDIPCADVLQTLVDLAPIVDDATWEQALESALRRRLVRVEQLEHLPPRTAGRPRIHRVLTRRPIGAPPTESLLETLAVQLARTVGGLDEPTRQHVVRWPDGEFVARVDLCWPRIGLFLELDGQHHKDQPVHDARRETAVVAATGWLPGRFTWYELTRIPRSSARRLGQLAEQARRRQPSMGIGFAS